MERSFRESQLFLWKGNICVKTVYLRRETEPGNVLGPEAIETTGCDYDTDGRRHIGIKVPQQQLEEAERARTGAPRGTSCRGC